MPILLLLLLVACAGGDAACLDIPEETVRTRYFRARRLLQRQVEQQLSVNLPNLYEFHLLRCDRVVAAVLMRIAPPA